MRDGLHRRSGARTGVLAWLAGAALAAGSAVAAGATPAWGDTDRVLVPSGPGAPPGRLLAVRTSSHASSKEQHHADARSRKASPRDDAAAPAKDRSRRGSRDRHEAEPDQDRSRRDAGRDTGSGNKARHRAEGRAATPPGEDRDKRHAGRTHERGDHRPAEAVPEESHRGRRRRDTNLATPNASTAAGPPPERPLPLDEGDGFRPPAAAATTTPEAPLVPDYLPAPAASAPVAVEDFERAFPGLSGLEPCDAVERLRATLKLRGIVVASAEPDRVVASPGSLAAAEALMGLRHLVRSRDTNTAHQRRSSTRERGEPRTGGRGRGREAPARDERDDSSRERHRGRDTGQARGGRRNERRPVVAPTPRYVPPALSSRAYRIPSDALIARIRELQPACDDQRIAERAGRAEPAASAAPPAPAAEAPASRRAEPASTQAPAASDAEAPGAVYQSGMASWYGRLFHGRRTASGERYDMFKYTAAHLRLPLGTFVRIWRRDHRKMVVVKVNDRGPYHSGRILDLSYAAAQVLGLTGAGSGPIEIELLDRRTGGTTLAREEAVFTSRRLEAGAFTDPADAEVRRQTLADAGFADAVVVPVPGVGLYAVRVGPYATASALETARSRIERLGLIVDAVPD